jgi:antitoxin VapB
LNDGTKYLICNDSEAPRMMNEGMADLGYQLVKYDWYEANPQKDVREALIKKLSAGGKIGSDVPFPGTILVADKFEPLRYSLTDPEIKRYRWLGKQTTQAVEAVCRRLKPGMSEYEIEALTAAEIRSRGILPTVLLIGVDDRIYQYRHALPGGATLEKYAMVNVVTEKWGMPMAVTRFVHFGPIPEDLKIKLNKTAEVNAHFQQATVPGKSCADIFEQCKVWYADVGYDGEWKKHHQGGAIGYNDREYVIYPGIDKTVQTSQAFAWNPTITGAKIEDTIIAFEDHFEIVTRTEDWPLIEIMLNDKIFPQPDILIIE